MTRQVVRMTVNGIERFAEAEPRKLLVDFLRDDLELTGTHIGCEHGVCGACTIQLDGEAVRSCLMFAVQAAGATLNTVEGLADGPALNVLQRAFHEHHALQCGFCTAGILMTMSSFLRGCPDPSRLQIREALSGNICRCTGYQNIIEAVLAAAREMRASSGGTESTR